MSNQKFNLGDMVVVHTLPSQLGFVRAIHDLGRIVYEIGIVHGHVTIGRDGNVVHPFYYEETLSLLDHRGVAGELAK